MALPIGTESAYLLDLYGRYRRDPLSVPSDWRVYFEAEEPTSSRTGSSGETLAAQLQDAWRRDGHLEARLDPLGLKPTETVPLLERLRQKVEATGATMVDVRIGSKTSHMSLTQYHSELVRIYAGHAALEASHIEDETIRDWLHEQHEAAYCEKNTVDELRRALDSIALADTFENFVRVKFPSKKRFGIEGAESTIVFLREVLRCACLSGFRETTMGGMHRGRLATLATVLQKPVAVLLAEIKGRDLTNGGPDFTGDVPYHLGYAGTISHDGRDMAVSILPHPSHLMTVAPVATGLTRAKRRGRGDDVLCLLMHTDAAFSGQGLVSEVMQLGRLPAYGIGGTIHLVVNNQIGFTTDPEEGRSSRYCTDIAKMVGGPVLHVNGDDPMAVLRAARLAHDFRKTFRRDIVLDLVCYRRNGHNELDEPRFSHPRLWASIDSRPSLRASFAAEVRRIDPAIHQASEATALAFHAEMQQGYETIETVRVNAQAGRPEAWQSIARASADDLLKPVRTGLALDHLQRLGEAASMIPQRIKPHGKVAQFYAARTSTIQQGMEINFATAEALAFASLLHEGISLRLSGQDCVRGTFTQRHLAVHDIMTDERVMPLSALATQGAIFEAANSPLSEYGVLGFEYGHSLFNPRQLTLWEAQFGDFLNGAQTMVDQYIVSAEAKWEMMSGLVLLLPHGLEGQGPDHSSARIERLLQLAGGGNILIANPSTPANLFHLLRRQIIAPWRKPLFVIAPKSLLRRKEAVSTLVEFGPQTCFRTIIAEDKAEVRKAILCSGKIAYELEKRRSELELEASICILRIEQLYPLDRPALDAALAMTGAQDVIWCQEEPENQGAWNALRDQITSLPSMKGRRLSLCARPVLPVSAGGSIERHEEEQATLITRALDLHNNPVKP